MKFAVLGTGSVGQTLARKLVDLGYAAIMGSRSADNEKAAAFVNEAGGLATTGTFAEAAAIADIVIVCTHGAATLDALALAGAENLAGKILIDVTNPLDFSNGFPPTLLPAYTQSSLAEAVQAAHPKARVVKTLNTVNAAIMVDPQRLSEPGDIFVSGNDADAKAQTIDLLKQFGWPDPVDLGDITTARGTEHYLPLWVRLMGPAGGANFNIKIVK